jgi:rubrerythrin
VSRLPRRQEHLKTGFTAEAVAAAHYRAYAARAQEDGLPNLARHWLELAASKDELALAQLEAAGRVHGELADVKSATSEERYENDVLYPKMARSVDPETAQIFLDVVARQKDDLHRLQELRDHLQSSTGDVEAPDEGG